MKKKRSMKKKDNKKKLIIPIIILVLLSIGISIYLYIDYNTINYKKNITIKIGDKVPTNKDIINKEDLKKIKNTIKWNKLKLEKNRAYNIGNYNGTFKYKKKSYQIKLKVKDTKKPTVEGVKDIEITIGDNIDILKDIKVTDDSKDKIDTKVEGEYDINKEGTYNLKVIVTDKAKNKEEKEFKLIVKAKPKVEIKQPSNNTVKTGTTSKGYKIENINGIYYINGILIANKTYSLPSTYNPGGLTSEFMNNFNNMKTTASNEGINLWIKSGFRSYIYQNTIYNNYVARDGRANADTYSARPGHSEHQSGLAADINSLEQSWINTKEGQWLNNNCHKYGFIIRYPQGKEPITGYIYEPWHIRYVGTDLSSKLYNNGNWITIEEYFGITSKY